jgi:hypothetical protein
MGRPTTHPGSPTSIARVNWDLAAPSAVKKEVSAMA